MRFKFLFLVIFLFGISFVYADGCCFDVSSGICSLRVPYNSCPSPNIWNPDSSCNALSECSMGCCVLGRSVSYTTQRNCQIESSAKGFEFQWQPSSSANQCSSLSKAQTLGACIYDYDFCKFTEKKQCTPENFHEGKLCSDPSLKTRCKKTEKTKCFDDGNVYKVDSCGNRDELVNNCVYSEGYICQQKSSGEAFCKNLNCVDIGKKNGESWCIGLNGKILNSDVREVVFKKTNEKAGPIKKKGEAKDYIFQDNVGTRFFRQICIDGKVVTEPCADYRNEVCIPNGNNAKCVANPAQDCFAANVLDEETGLNKIENCDPEWCFVTRLDDCLQFLGEENIICGEERANWRNLPQAKAGIMVLEVSSDLMKELSLPMCVPKITTGRDLSSKNYSAKGECSIGDYGPKHAWLDHDMGSCDGWRIKESSTYNTIINSEEKRWGNAGLISLDPKDWKRDDCAGVGVGFCKVPNYSNHPLFFEGNKWCSLEDRFEINFPGMKSLASSGKIADPKLIELLNQRTIGLGDCAGKLNWLDVEGTTENIAESIVKRGTEGRTDHILFKFFFSAKDWRPPSSGNCTLCGADGLPCSEYRCKAIGKNCEYKEPKGIDSGVCVSSNDLRSPTIFHAQDPQNPVPPFSSVKIILNTDEDSYCKFDLSRTSGKIDNMKYETDGKFSRTHEFRLTMSRALREDEDVNNYPVLTKDGKYEIFIRCEDGAGNYNVNPYIINLEIMKTPDQIPPEILEFYPPSNSFVEFNKTTKKIKFRLNEPAECRWDLEDKHYDEMGISLNKEGNLYNLNQFSCDNQITEENIAKGFFCEGELRNITTVIGNSTRFYIKCQDQPELEGKEDQYYQRNKNNKSFQYVLKASHALEIIDFSPIEDYIAGSSIQNISIQLRTKDGAERGKAECKWRLKIGDVLSSWKLFNRTNSSTHIDLIPNPIETLYKIDVLCKDVAGNKASASYNLNLIIDRSPPKILRAYTSTGHLTISLDEKANCKFANNDGCIHVYNNGSSMERIKDKEFKTSLKKGTPYYIRCEDLFGNSACYPEIVVY